MNGAPSNHQTGEDAATDEVSLAGESASAAIARETPRSRQAKPGPANGPLRLHPALTALARLLARQAAREALTASRIEQET